jgi:hypothetical protein
LAIAESGSEGWHGGLPLLRGSTLASRLLEH